MEQGHRLWDECTLARRPRRRGNGGVAAIVKQTPYSIGYVELAYAIQSKLPYGWVKNQAGNFVGLEMADALVYRGLEVTLISRPSEVLSTVDPQLGQLVRKELDRKGVRVLLGREIQSITDLHDGKISVRDSKGLETSADLALVAVGVRPASELAERAGIKIGEQRAIRVNRAMQTSEPDIYAAGDCVETWHRLLNRPTFQPLGTTSHKQGRVAGENAVGGNAQFAGSLGTQVVKVFELAIARTGLRDEEARKAGFDPLTVQSTFWDHKAYYPGAQEIVFRICGDKNTGRLLGAQLIGQWKSEISKRVDIFATALFHNMTVESLNELDLSYSHAALVRYAKRHEKLHR